MKTILMLISLLALGVLLVAPTLHATREFCQYGMILGTVGWFATAPFWIKYR